MQYVTSIGTHTAICFISQDLCFIKCIVKGKPWEDLLHYLCSPSLSQAYTVILITQQFTYIWIFTYFCPAGTLVLAFFFAHSHYQKELPNRSSKGETQHKKISLYCSLYFLLLSLLSPGFSNLQYGFNVPLACVCPYGAIKQ